MTVPRDEATSILHDLDFNTLELDEQYAVDELDGLVEKAKAGFAAESTKHNFNIPSISTQEITGIVLSLDEMLNEIKGRILTVDK